MEQGKELVIVQHKAVAPSGTLLRRCTDSRTEYWSQLLLDIIPSKFTESYSDTSVNKWSKCPTLKYRRREFDKYCGRNVEKQSENDLPKTSWSGLKKKHVAFTIFCCDNSFSQLDRQVASDSLRENQ